MKRFLKSSWTIGIGTTVVGGIILAKLTNFDMFGAIGTIVIAICNLIISCLNFELKVWWILLSIIAIVTILYIVVKIVDSKNSGLPFLDFLNYTKDVIQDWHWIWQWEKKYDGKYDVENLHPICPKCETPLVSAGDYSGTIKCPRCNHNAGKNLPEEYIIKMMIKDNVQKGLIPKNSNRL